MVREHRYKGSMRWYYQIRTTGEVEGLRYMYLGGTAGHGCTGGEDFGKLSPIQMDTNFHSWHGSDFCKLHISVLIATGNFLL